MLDEFQLITLNGSNNKETIETNIYSIFFCGPSPLPALSPLIIIIFLRPVLIRLLFYSEDAGLGKKLAKAEVFSRTARIIMLGRLTQ